MNNDQNPNDAISCDNVVAGTLCGPALGTELISLFGAVPEAFKATPLVYTQCPEPGSAPGTCTMHASRLDLAPVLAQPGLYSEAADRQCVSAHAKSQPRRDQCRYQCQGDLVAGHPGSGDQSERLADARTEAAASRPSKH